MEPATSTNEQQLLDHHFGRVIFDGALSFLTDLESYKCWGKQLPPEVVEMIALHMQALLKEKAELEDRAEEWEEHRRGYYPSQTTRVWNVLWIELSL